MAYFKKILLLLFVCIIYECNLHAQGEFETSREPDNYNLNSFGIKLNSNGFGAMYSFAQRKTYRLRRFFEIEYNYLKDPKEVKIINNVINLFSQKSFIYGKLNSVHNFRFGYGYNRMIFEKRDKSSISIHLLGSAGLSLCISKPIYYEIVDSASNDPNYYYVYTSYKKFDPSEQTGSGDIVAKAPIYMGFKEIKVQPGIYAKFGIAFDFSKDVMKTNVLEVGTAFDYYFIPLEIMSGNPRRSIFSLYIAYNFGQKYNANLNREFRKEQRKLERNNSK